MKRSSRLILLCVVLLSLGCSSVSVSTDFDDKIDFKKFSTYDWLASPETPSQAIQKELTSNTLVEARVKRAVDAQLPAKGLRKTTQNPDVLVAFHTGVEDKVDVQSWGYGYGWGWRYGGGGITTINYQEGTLILDFIDPATNQLMWRGVAKKVLSKNTTPEKSEKGINEAVQKILEKYPPS
jgi:Domain of unknown function (DUF4136)